MCGNCSGRKIPLPRMGYASNERVCNDCATIDDLKNYTTGEQPRRRVNVPDPVAHPFLVHNACKVMAAVAEHDPLWSFVFPQEATVGNRPKLLQEFFWMVCTCATCHANGLCVSV